MSFLVKWNRVDMGKAFFPFVERLGHVRVLQTLSEAVFDVLDEVPLTSLRSLVLRLAPTDACSCF